MFGYHRKIRIRKERRKEDGIMKIRYFTCIMRIDYENNKTYTTCNSQSIYYLSLSLCLVFYI